MTKREMKTHSQSVADPINAPQLLCDSCVSLVVDTQGNEICQDDVCGCMLVQKRLKKRASNSMHLRTSITMPPDPAPWIARPAISILPLVAPPQIPLPRVKRAVTKSINDLRPNTLQS